MDVKEEEQEVPKSSIKRIKKSKVAGKEILLELECSEKFFIDEGLTDVFELLKAQGWEKLCEKQEKVCSEAVYEFYGGLSLVDGAIPALEVEFRGHKLRVSSLELAVILNLPHFGYDLFSKGNTWPEEAENKKDLVKRICGLDKVPKGSLSTKFMEPKTKILHKLLVSNFTQRGAKPSYCQHEDLLLLDKILKKEKVNLPKLMIYQMNHIKKLTQLGFSRVIKRILETYQVYEISSGVEKPIVKAFDPDVFRKMNLVKDPELGWVRTSVVQVPELFQESDGDEDLEENPDLVSGSDVSRRLKAIEKGLSEVQKDMKELKSSMQELKKEVTALLEKL